MNFIRISMALFLSVLMMSASIAEARVMAFSLSRGDDNFLNAIRDSLATEIDSADDYFYAEPAGTDFDEQVAQVSKFVAAGVDAVFIVTKDTSRDAMTRLAAARNGKSVPIVLINTEPTADAFPLPPNMTYVGSDELESGTLEMEALARKADYKGKVAILVGEPNHYAAKTRTEDVEKVVAKYPGMKVTLTASANWRRNEALSIVSGWLKNKPDEFSIIAANNDEMALGAILAMRQQNIPPERYLIGGIDATSDALNAMHEGTLDVTVLQDAKGQAKAAVRAAYKMLSGTGVEQKIWVPFRLITPENLDYYRQ